MLLSNKEKYKNIIIGKLELEGWKLTCTSEVDKKLYDMLIGEPMKFKGSKKISMEKLVYIIFGRNSLEALLTNGLI